MVCESGSGWICLSKEADIRIYSLADNFQIIHDMVLQFIANISYGYLTLIVVTTIGFMTAAIMITLRNAVLKTGEIGKSKDLPNL